MKKRIYNILTLSIACLVFNTCTDLEDGAYSTIVSSQFDPSAEDVGSLVGSAYTRWQSVIYRDGYELQEISADGLVMPAKPYGFVDGGRHKRAHQHNWTGETDRILTMWRNTYSGITNSNRIIYQLESGEIPLEEDDKEQYIAELRVLRASYYYVLCDLFGNVPIVTDFDVPEGYLPEQNTRAEVYDFIVSEITTSLPYLSEASNSSTYGRFNNKWSAYALLARMYLNAEVFSGSEQWEKAIEAADAIIDSEHFSLETQQKDVFLANNHNSNEIIWAVPYDEIYGSSTFRLAQVSMTQQNQFTFNTRYDGWGGLVSVPQFIDTFHPEDERYEQNWMKGQQYTSGGEMLYVQTGALAGEPLSYVNEVPSIDSTEEVHSFRIHKWEIEAGSASMNNDFPVFRYADVLLTKAEGLLRTGYADEAALLVTEVRKRNFPNDLGLATVTGDQLTQGSIYEYGITDVKLPNTNEGGGDIQFGRFLDELGWEFAAEGRRRQDMIRFGVYTTKSRLAYSPNGDHKTLFPIPFEELQNNSNLDQNPGY